MGGGVAVRGRQGAGEVGRVGEVGGRVAGRGERDK